MYKKHISLISSEEKIDVCLQQESWLAPKGKIISRKEAL